MIFRSQKKIPGWFVGIVVLLTGLVTFWAMLKRNDGQLWANETAFMSQKITQVLSPAANVGDPNVFKQVAAQRPPPTIKAGSLPPHADQGACTLCHLVVDQVGSVIPMIKAYSSLPHPYRGGICINCHQVSGHTSTNPPPPGNVIGAMRPVAGARARPVPRVLATNEGAWLGMDVVPITALTTQQYNLPRNSLGGVVVAEVEAAALQAGLQAGDVITAINGVPVGDMSSFQQTTQNGMLPAATLDVLRQGQQFRLQIGGVASGVTPQVQGQLPSPGSQPLRPVAGPGGWPAGACGTGPGAVAGQPCPTMP